VNWSNLGEVGTLVVSTWIFVSITVFPRFVRSSTVLIVTVLLGGAIIVWGFSLVSAWSPFMFGFCDFMVGVAALLAALHREIIERIRTGRWRFLEKGPNKID
jgi:hypothetical protein